VILSAGIGSGPRGRAGITEIVGRSPNEALPRVTAFVTAAGDAFTARNQTPLRGAVRISVS
jgi:hypothetical protein